MVSTLSDLPNAMNLFLDAFGFEAVCVSASLGDVGPLYSYFWLRKFKQTSLKSWYDSLKLEVLANTLEGLETARDIDFYPCFDNSAMVQSQAYQVLRAFSKLKLQVP